MLTDYFFALDLLIMVFYSLNEYCVGDAKQNFPLSKSPSLKKNFFFIKLHITYYSKYIV